MSCRPKGYGQKNNSWKKTERSARWERWVGNLFMAALAVLFAWYISTSWLDGREPKPRKKWEQMPGNDGKFWKGTPDGGAYADLEGAELKVYYQYFYDREGRLSKINTFRPHEYYEDVWCLSNEETYEYDSQGRVVRRQEIQGGGERNYEYTEDGCTEYYSYYPHKNGRITRYDAAGNRIYFRNAENYRYPHVTTWEYDGKNRLVKEMLEVEGKPPNGLPPHVILSVEYDEENYTAVETEYNSKGEITYIWFNTYDKDWNKTESVWYAPESVPEGYSPEECRDYYTRGYWVSYSDGKIQEEMKNEPWKADRNDSEYTAYDYDGRGNCILELKVHSTGYVYLYRYVYDAENRLTEKFNYDSDDVKFWEQLQWDGSRLTLAASDDGPLNITRSAVDGTLLNRFVYGKEEVETQQTPTETIFWQRTPALILAERGPKPVEPEPGEEKPDEKEPDEKEPGGDPGTDQPVGPKTYYRTVREGDCLWSIAEDYLGHGQEYLSIYEKNRDVIGADPRLIQPGMRLEIEASVTFN